MSLSRGYNSYRGRGNRSKTVISLILILVILLAAGYLILQNYIVYDEQGNAALQFPAREPTVSEPKPSAVSPDEVDLEYVEPESSVAKTLPTLHAAQLPSDALRKQGLLSALLQQADEAMIIEVKYRQGALSYDTAVDVPDDVPVYREGTRQTLQELLNSDRFTVARIAALWDGYYVRAYPESALLRQNASKPGLWYDAENNYRTWLNPADERVIRYLTELSCECADMGFDEIMLDYFFFPTSSSSKSIINAAADRTETLRTFAETVRAALPENVLLSVVVREDAVSRNGGLTAEMLSETFDRIYVAPEFDDAALREALPESFDQNTRIVPMVYTKPDDEGSYAVVTG